MNTSHHLAPSNPYLMNLIMSSSSSQLITLLYDGLVRYLGAAYDGFSETDIQKRNETINNNLVRAQNIITELNASLDKSKGGELAAQLGELYDFFNLSLRQINSSKDPSVILRVVHMVTELRDAWATVAAPVNSPGATSRAMTPAPAGV